MNDKRRKYGVVASVDPVTLDRHPAYAQRIEEELVYRCTDPIVKEAIKGECIVRFSETEQQQDITYYRIDFRKYVYIEDLVRCKNCLYWESETPTFGVCPGSLGTHSEDYCSRGRRRDETERR